MLSGYYLLSRIRTVAHEDEGRDDVNDEANQCDGIRCPPHRDLLDEPSPELLHVRIQNGASFSAVLVLREPFELLRRQVVRHGFTMLRRPRERNREKGRISKKKTPLPRCLSHLITSDHYPVTPNKYGDAKHFRRKNNAGCKQTHVFLHYAMMTSTDAQS
jgi:hypothetical protein